MSFDKSTLELISKQTNIQDLDKIAAVLTDCRGDGFAAIYKLMDLDMPPIRGQKLPNERNVFDDIREICDAKDTVFQQRLKST